MTLQWNFIAGFLYLEIAVLIMLISPVFGAKFYNYFFRCRLYGILKEHTKVYFLSILGILCVFLLDSMAEMQKYSQSNNLRHSNLSSKLKDNVKLFRAQRNFYIVSFSIFLAVVIKRLITMFRNHYELQLKAETVMSKAEDAMRLTKTRLSETKQLLKKLKKVAKTHGSCPCIVATALKEGEIVGQGDELETS